MADRARPPQLVLRQHSIACGYGPRTIQLAASEEALFVGCKDGSVTVVQIPRQGAQRGALVGITLAMRSGAGVRSICEWDDQRILVGRVDGELHLIRWKGTDGLPDAAAEIEKVSGGLAGLCSGDPVQSCGWVDDSRLFVSFRYHGCQIIEKGPEGAVGEPVRLQVPRTIRSAVRWVAPVASGASAAGDPKWLLVTERGELLEWSGETAVPARPAFKESGWPEGETPGSVNDITLVRGDDDRPARRPAREALLATDTGIYVVTRNAESGAFQGCRISLTGLGAMCTTLTYAEYRQYRFLWAADIRGDCHFFWDEPPDSPWLNFRRLGSVHAESRVLHTSSWHSRNLDSLAIGQARRDDQIVISQYRPLDEVGDLATDRPTAIRRLLNDEEDEEKIKGFFRETDEARHGSSEEEPEYEKWPPQAILVELFERLAADDKNRQLLLESLLGRSALADRVLAGLAAGSLDGEPVAAAGQSGRAERETPEQVLQLWTLTLLGIIHHHRGDRDSAYLALLRWLRTRQQRLWIAGVDQTILETIEDSIRFVRKWGIHGDSYAWRENLIRPLSSLWRQEKEAVERSRPGPVSERLDRLVYQARLYQRGVSLIDEVRLPAMRGRTAWDLAMIPIADTRIVAVSWNWGGVEIFEVGTADGEARLLPRLALRPGKERRDQDYSFRVEEIAAGQPPLEIPRFRYGYSRAIHLGSVQRRAFLLTAPATAPRIEEEEVVYLWRLRAEEDGGLRIDEQPDTFQIAAGESVYSLLELEEGWLLAGLRGREGIPKIALLSISVGAGGLEGRRSKILKIEEPSLAGRKGRASPSESRNRVWSLAKARLGSDEYRVVAGCGAGEIYRFRLVRRADSWQVAIDSRPRFECLTVMSSPVSALAYREGSDGPTRLYAGGEDGSVVAWQELVEERDSTSPRGVDDRASAVQTRFASLWSTWERGAIADIHRLPGLKLHEAGDSVGAIMIVTRSGRCVLVDDRARVGRRRADDRARANRRLAKDLPKRIHYPGCRHGRFDLRTSCFASLPVSDHSDGGRVSGLEPFSELLAASGEGTLRWIGIYDPHYTGRRDLRYRQILESWRQSIVLHGHQLRLGGAVYTAAPHLELILVRWLLDPSYPGAASDGDRPDGEMPDNTWEDLSHLEPWWLPRHLRPLLELRRKWEESDPAAGDFLELALKRAWQLDDVRLFQEICEVTLKRLNASVYSWIRRKRETPERDERHWSLEKERIGELHNGLFGAFERRRGAFRRVPRSTRTS